MIDARGSPTPCTTRWWQRVIANIWGQMNAAAKVGVKKVGVCSAPRSTACSARRGLVQGGGQSEGHDPDVRPWPRRRQPSYTANCLAAKQSGAEALAAFVNETLLPATARPGLQAEVDQRRLGPDPLHHHACRPWATRWAPRSTGTASDRQGRHQGLLDRDGQVRPPVAQGRQQVRQPANSDCSAWDAGRDCPGRASGPTTRGSTDHQRRRDQGLSTFQGKTPTVLTRRPSPSATGPTPTRVAGAPTPTSGRARPSYRYPRTTGTPDATHHDHRQTLLGGFLTTVVSPLQRS